MSEEDALLAAIHANPDDDTPRLAYADWLDEHDRPERAEFIRVQIECSHLTDDDPRELPLRERRWELWRAHCKQWTAELGIVEDKKIETEFRRGFIDGLSLCDDASGGVDLVCRVPGVRRVRLWRVTLTPEAVRRLAALELDSLTINEVTFPKEWLELLEPLPCGTVLSIVPKDEPFAPDVWREFQLRRVSRLAYLTPAERYAEARRWQRGHDEHHGYTRGIKDIQISDVKACDAEMQLLAELKEVEDIHVYDSDLTTAGIEHIAKLPNLKSLCLSWVPATSIAPLARCSRLEELSVSSEYRISIGDVGTEELDQLVNLRELRLRSVCGEMTLARLGSLRKLTSLDIELRGIENTESFAALSNLTALERLEIDGDVPGHALKFLAPCRRLQTVAFRVPTGHADDFAAWGVLSELRKLQIQGVAVTDDAIQHLAPLKKLHRLLAQRTSVTPAGARWLADQLPEVTVILDEYVAKSRRSAFTFCRQLSKEDEAVSAVLPTHWFREQRGSLVTSSWIWQEDGWQEIGALNYEIVGPAEIGLYADEKISPEAIMADHLRCRGTSGQPIAHEHNIVDLAGKGKSCVYSLSRDRYLVVAIAGEAGCAVLQCSAPSTRFEEFRPLFTFIARSLRVGPAALEGVGEEVTVPMAQL